MVVHTCERCKVDFNKKSNYLNHIGRKYQCKEKIEEIIENPIILLNNGENQAFFEEQNMCIHCQKSYSNIYNLNSKCNIEVVNYT